MNLTERFDAATAKMDELKEKLEKASKEVKESFEQGVENFKSDMKITRDSFEEIAEDQEARHDAKVAAQKAKAEATADAVKESVTEGVANYKSDMEILRNSLREIAVEVDEQTDIADTKIAADRASRVDAARAKVAQAKAQVEKVEEAFDKADREELIYDLLVYAEECQALADAMADEAEIALKAAAQQIALYEEAYGPIEE